MSFWSRFTNPFRQSRVNRELDEELASHLEEAAAHGRDPQEARRAFGSPLRHREASRDAKLSSWIDSLRSDIIFGWRQLRKKPITSAAVIVSLALAIGACTSAFRLVDALLLRPLPVEHPETLYAISRLGTDPGGNFRASNSWEYPLFERMRAAVDGEADLIAMGVSNRNDITFVSDAEMEKATTEHVSAIVFGSFGIQPALGRVLTADDDNSYHSHPYAVLSYDYWTRRFARDPKVLGRHFRFGDDLFEIVGVSEKRFAGTEPGTVVDIFVPATMYTGATHSDWSWFRTFAHLRTNAAPEVVRQKLYVQMHAFDAERAKSFTASQPQALIDTFLKQSLILEPAAAGVSGLQSDYRSSLAAIAVLVALILLIACANVANLMTAQAAARAREMAVRVSIGAGRGRLVQLVLIESILLAAFAAVLGAVFAWWSAPFVVSRLNLPSNPVRLDLPFDWRVFTFGLSLTFIVALLLGLAPALRASAIRPISALKGEDRRSRGHLMYGLVAAQVAFCFLVHFVTGLFVASFNRLANLHLGFSSERVLLLDTVAQQPQPTVYWDLVTDHLRALPGVESASLSGWALLSGNGWNGFISVNGAPLTSQLAFFLAVSPGWLETMKIPILDGRDLLPGDTFPGAAIVNQTFVRQYFPGVDPIGKFFEKSQGDNSRMRCQIVGVVQDAWYRNIRQPIPPIAYVSFHALDNSGARKLSRSATLTVRSSSANPSDLAEMLRREVPGARPGFRVSNITTEEELVRSQTVRERLLAMLALFFAVVALALAGVGLYGVLDYSVLQRRREIGIRIAVGAQSGRIVRLVAADIFAMVAIGAVAGLALGLLSARYVASLFYQVKATDVSMLALPWLTILAATSLAALPAVIRAVRIDPVKMLRAE
jgi:putative ABC transport system permease protein